MTRRKKAPLRPLTELESAQLLKLSRSHTEPAASVARAKAVLAVAAGSNYLQAARAVGYRGGDCVAGWVSRFNSEGVPALQPRHGGGAPKKYASAEREQILNTFRTTPDRDEDGTATWSLSTLQQTLRKNGLGKMSTSTLWQVLHEAGISWQRTRTWCQTGVVKRVRRSGVVEVLDPEADAKKKAHRAGVHSG